VGERPAGSEPAIFAVKGKLDEDHAGRLDPGEMRWNVVEQLCSSVQLGCWGTGDGRELIVGQPNYKQEIQFLLVHRRVGRSTVKDLELSESVRDRYAMIESFGTGAGGDDDYGAGVISHKGNAFDGPNADGTGRDFQFPKRLCKSQNALQSNAEAGRDAAREMIRRNFNRQKFTAELPLHGQQYRSTMTTLFACDTLARVIWEEPDGILYDNVGLIYEAKFRCSAKEGETTSLSLVPRGTVFVA
jgi:prophage tail gpP-like protein